MGSSLRRSHRAWLLKVVCVLVVCFTAGLVTSGVVSGAGPLAALSTLSETDPPSTETTETTDTSPTDTTETTDTEPTETTETEPEPEPVPPCVATGDETLAADKPAYLPGGRALLTGSGYEPSCEVTLRVTLPDETVTTEAVTTDRAAASAHVYALPSPAVPGEYLAETLDADDAVLASTTFDGLEPTAGTPTIWTDRDDYAPGEIFELRGAGWLPGEAIQVSRRRRRRRHVAPHR